MPYDYNFDRDILRKKLYEKFKFFWLANHGHTIEELIKSVMDYAEESYGDPSMHPYKQLVEDWEKECGFGGEIYPCYSEFITSEYLDVDFMVVNLCWNEEKHLYLNDPYLEFADDDESAGE